MNNGYQKSNGCGADKEGGEIFNNFSILNFNRSASARLPITLKALAQGFACLYENGENVVLGRVQGS